MVTTANSTKRWAYMNQRINIELYLRDKWLMLIIMKLGQSKFYCVLATAPGSAHVVPTRIQVLIVLFQLCISQVFFKSIQPLHRWVGTDTSNHNHSQTFAFYISSIITLLYSLFPNHFRNYTQNYRSYLDIDSTENFITRKGLHNAREPRSHGN